MIESLANAPARPCDYRKVLPDLLAQIAPVADVYPSENYYYFQFFAAGRSYSGNVRLSVDDRDSGVLHFVCYNTYTTWLQPELNPDDYRKLSAHDGVAVERVEPRLYRVSAGGKSALFRLHALDHSTRSSRIGPGDVLVGRTFDDSGLRFELLYNEQINRFYFVLQESEPPADELVRIAEHLHVGRRTGFAFYEDSLPDRFVLVAISALEGGTNSAYDGPFDHLPENDYAKIGFWDFAYRVYPSLRGTHTPGGRLEDGSIFGVGAYTRYSNREDLKFIADCERRHEPGPQRIACLTDHNSRSENKPD